MITIIAGTYKGVVLKSMPKGARPVTQKNRAAIFSTLGELVVGAQVLDLYAGSGALGLEALSRGAAEVTLVDKSTAALTTNAKAMAASTIAIHKQDVDRFVESSGSRYDIVLMDPPYEQLDARMVQLTLNLLKSDGVLVLSCTSRADLTLLQSNIVKQKVYGDSQIVYLRN